VNSSVLPVILIALGGLFVGGVISMRQQGAGKFAQGLLGVLALVSVAGGVLWMVGKG
jgi:hypothetical protein